jgi:hypothetical protein
VCIPLSAVLTARRHSMRKVRSNIPFLPSFPDPTRLRHHVYMGIVSVSTLVPTKTIVCRSGECPHVRKVRRHLTTGPGLDLTPVTRDADSDRSATGYYRI